jgi:hypothetical protein
LELVVPGTHANTIRSVLNNTWFDGHKCDARLAEATGRLPPEVVALSVSRVGTVVVWLDLVLQVRNPLVARALSVLINVNKAGAWNGRSQIKVEQDK